MAIKLALVVTLFLMSCAVSKGRSLGFSTKQLDRYSFPPNFSFGVGSSAYQYEGAVAEGGRTQSIWDNFTHAYPGGKLSDGVNNEGIQFYKNLIDEILKNGIKPFVTIYHWDIPQALDDEYGGFLSPRIILCVAGDSSTEPYVVSHHLLLAHAAAVEEFRNCDKISQDGKIGIVLSPFWVEPYDVNSHADKEAVERALDYYLGWHLDPLIFGDYPKAIKRNAGKRLPSFTRKQTEMIRNSFDFIGINYYSARYVTRQLQSDPSRLRFTTDQHVEYKGYDDYDVGTVPREQLLKDTKRIEYHEKHLQELHKAITEDGCDVRGYSAWSLLDNFEWEHGYTMRFGLYYVDYADDLKRYAKDSAKWFKKFLERKEQATPLDLFNSIKKWWSALQMV
ncbi:hypothetical protein F2Q70_00024605 [Brassica cretica]|uniref:thioglucosidase n=1 Tax=Brassica cretica TaxID=69181 RepID=A0A8S9IEC5_BRACR|nr:hypothetical protein F2Q68_00023924 [Brassica cretica]KAF2602830.1 hypothetical protein F2Q70_00024605 [Brassica cretica]